MNDGKNLNIINVNNKQQVKEQIVNLDKPYKKKDKDRRVMKEREIDNNVMITGNQLRPGEIVTSEKIKNKNQKSIIGWF